MYLSNFFYSLILVSTFALKTLYRLGSCRLRSHMYREGNVYACGMHISCNKSYILWNFATWMTPLATPKPHSWKYKKNKHVKIYLTLTCFHRLGRDNGGEGRCEIQKEIWMSKEYFDLVSLSLSVSGFAFLGGCVAQEKCVISSFHTSPWFQTSVFMCPLREGRVRLWACDSHVCSIMTTTWLWQWTCF